MMRGTSSYRRARKEDSTAHTTLQPRDIKYCGMRIINLIYLPLSPETWGPKLERLACDTRHMQHHGDDLACASKAQTVRLRHCVLAFSALVCVNSGERAFSASTRRATSVDSPIL